MDRLRRKITTHRAALSAVACALGGLLLLFLSEFVSWCDSYQWLQSLIRQLGTLLLATIAISLIWHLYLRRSFLNEVMGIANLGEEVRNTGLIDLTDDFKDGLDWEKLITESREVDILVGYARSWRNNHRSELHELSRKQSAEVRVILPNPSDQDIIGELGRRWGGIDPQEVAKRISDARDDFKSIFASRNADFELWLTEFTPAYSAYRFDNKIITSIYYHRSGRHDVPAYTFKEGGSIYEFYKSELSSITSKSTSLATRKYP